MMGFVYKDFLVMRKQLRYYLVFLVIYGGLSALGTMPYSVLAGLVVLIPMIVPMSSFSYDDLARWDKFAAATPAGRRGVVAGKYVLFLLTLVCSTVVIAGVLLAMGTAGLIVPDTWWEPMLAVLTCASLVMLLNSIILPLLFKFGAEKSRTISLVLFAAIFGGMLLLALMRSRPAETFHALDWLRGLLNWMPLWTALLGVAALAASYFLSLRIYARKEL